MSADSPPENEPLAPRLIKTVARLPRESVGFVDRKIRRLGVSLRKLPHKILVRGYHMQLGRLYHYKPRRRRPERFPWPTLRASALPAIAMVTPSFRQASFIRETMDSVLDQNYPKLCYAVLDGGSKDGTKDILEEYAPRLFHWVSEPDRGQSDAVNRGFQIAQGEIMAWLNSDDLLQKGALRFVGEYFARHPEVDVVYGHRVLIDETGREIGRWVLPAHQPEGLRFVDYVPQETLFWRRELYDRVGGIDTSFHFALDWDLLLRFQRAGANIVRLPYFLGCFRVHPEQKTSAQIGSTGTREMERILLKEHGRELTRREIDQVAHRMQISAVMTARLLSCGIRR